MNKEFKKGVLEICVLSFVNKEDRYGYQIVKELENKFEVKESTIYPILKRLHKEGILETYLKESSNGPVRKYYKITNQGEELLIISIKRWNDFVNIVNDYLSE